MTTMAKIETGVDKLVDLINIHKKISVDDAAKKLGVSSVVVQEWADFLAEEELISVEYKFNKTILEERKLSKTQIKEKTEEFTTERDAFIRKVETSLKSLEKETTGLTKIKEEFNKLKNEIGNEIDKVKDEVQELEKYDDLKKNLDKQIEDQQKEYHVLLDRAHKEINQEEVRYTELLEKIDIEKREFEIKGKQLKTLEEKEKQLMERLNGIYELTKETQGKISSGQKDIATTEQDISSLERKAKDIETQIQKKKASIQPIVDKVKDSEKQITTLQNQILAKVKEKSSSIKSQVKEGELATKKFETFFKKKKEIEAILEQIDRDKEDLRQELGVLVKKATSFDVATKSTNIKVHVCELEKELKKVETKKDKFKKELSSLLKLIKG